VRLLIVPGIGGSDAQHWQSVWEAEFGEAAVRIAPESWDDPDHENWHESLDRALARLPTGPVLIVAHSLGCLSAASWLVERKPDAVVGAFLVAPPDRDGPTFPSAASSFELVRHPLPVPTVVVASSNDPYSTLDAAREMARGWGAPLIEVGPLGHVNSESALGRWDAGRALLDSFVLQLERAGGRPDLRIERDDVSGADVRALLREHLDELYATSPPESVHALDVSQLSQPHVSFWTVRSVEGELLGCGALARLDESSAEVKSMRTTATARGRGVASALLAHLIDEGRRSGYRCLLLETGSQDFFAAARRLYERAGFAPVPPFADYTEDPNSVYLRLDL
jgi:putative acetyltransferase